MREIACNKIRAHFLAGLALGMAGCAHYTNRPLNPEATAAAFDQRSLDSEELHQFLLQNAGPSAEPWPRSTWDYESLSWVAFHYHPALEVARAQWEVLKADQITAGTRPNPSLSITPGYNATASGSSPWFPAVGFDLPLETANKRQLRSAGAAQAAESARQSVFSVAWQVRSDLYRALVAWEQARERARLLNRQADTERQILTLLEERQAAGAISAVEVTTARIAWTRSDADAADAQRQSTVALAVVAQSLGVPLAAVSRLAVENAPVPAEPFRGDKLGESRALALRSRPELLAVLADYEKTQGALQLEIARQYPDIHLGPGYQWDQGASKWSLSLTAEIPLFNRNAGPIAAAEARRHESAARFTELQSRLANRIDQAIAVWDAAGTRSLAATRIAQSVDQQLANQQTRLQVGDINQLDYLLSRRESLVAGLNAIDARAAAALANIDLEAVLQVPLAGPGSLPVP